MTPTSTLRAAGLLAAGALASTAFDSTAYATSVESASFQELVKSAHACVVGDLAATSSVTIDGATYTDATFTVSDVAFGPVGSQVTVRVPGGRVTTATIPVNEIAPGMPKFLSGSDYVLLLGAPDTSGHHTLAGDFQGAIAVAGDTVRLPQGAGLLPVDDAVDAIRDIRDDASTNARTGQ